MSIKLLASTLLLSLAAHTVNAWQVMGYVYCDANTNHTIDAADAPVQGVMVVVTNSSGTFQGTCWTAADGFFIIELPAANDTYVDYVHPATLPAGTVQMLPALAAFTLSDTVEYATNSFLLENPACVSTNSPGPGPGPAGCWLTGGGTFKFGAKGQPAHSFGGNVYPGCNSNASEGGNWDDVDHVNNLHFKALAIQVTDCGNVPGAPPGSSSPSTGFNFIDFEGVASLQGIAGNHVDYGDVYFSARAEDLGEPGDGVDRLYLRVYDTSGQTLMLISADPAHPLDVAPLTITTGNLQMHSCKPGKSSGNAAAATTQ